MKLLRDFLCVSDEKELFGLQTMPSEWIESIDGSHQKIFQTVRPPVLTGSREPLACVASYIDITNPSLYCRIPGHCTLCTYSC